MCAVFLTRIVQSNWVEQKIVEAFIWAFQNSSLSFQPLFLFMSLQNYRCFRFDRGHSDTESLLIVIRLERDIVLIMMIEVNRNKLYLPIRVVCVTTSAREKRHSKQGTWSLCASFLQNGTIDFGWCSIRWKCFDHFARRNSSPNVSSEEIDVKEILLEDHASNHPDSPTWSLIRLQGNVLHSSVSCFEAERKRTTRRWGNAALFLISGVERERYEALFAWISTSDRFDWSRNINGKWNGKTVRRDE